MAKHENHKYRCVLLLYFWEALVLTYTILYRLTRFQYSTLNTTHNVETTNLILGAAKFIWPQFLVPNIVKNYNLLLNLMVVVRVLSVLLKLCSEFQTLLTNVVWLFYELESRFANYNSPIGRDLLIEETRLQRRIIYAKSPSRDFTLDHSFSAQNFVLVNTSRWRLG